MSQIFNLKVEPDRLVSTAKELSRAVLGMRGDFAKLKSSIGGTKGYWLGEAGDYHRKLYTEQEDKMEELLKDLEQYPTDILKMAGLYKESEQKNVQMAQSLKSDVIH